MRMVPVYEPGTVFVCAAEREPLKITNSLTSAAGAETVSTAVVPVAGEQLLNALVIVLAVAPVPQV